MPAGSVVQGMAQSCLQWAAFVQIQTARYSTIKRNLTTHYLDILSFLVVFAVYSGIYITLITLILLFLIEK